MTIAHRRSAGVGAGLAAVFLGVLAFVVIVLLIDALSGGSSGTSTTQGSGDAVAQPRPVPAFRGVELSGGMIVNVRPGAARSVVVHADDNLVGRVTTNVVGGRLVVGSTGGGFRAKAPMYVDVTAPAVSTIALTGSGIVFVFDVSQPALNVVAPGSGLLRASGKVGSLRVSMSGSGDVDLLALTASSVEASLPGSGTIAVTATHRIDASVSGSGVILYGGDPPHVTTSVTGTGTIRRA